MNNVLLVAKKEFLDLISSKLTMIIFFWYIITFIFSFYFIVHPNGDMPPVIANYDNPVDCIFITFVFTLCYYGTLVAVVIGFNSMSAEIDGKALNTLLVKPLYRDTIINGKILGMIGFILCLFLFTTILYILTMFLYFGIIDSYAVFINSYLPLFISMMPLAFLLSILCITFFLSVSMFTCLTFKEQSFSLFMSLFIWIMLFCILNNQSFAGYIDFFTHNQDLGHFISGLSPTTMLSYIFENRDVRGALINNSFEVFKLFMYCFVALISTYTTFIRRDVA